MGILNFRFLGWVSYLLRETALLERRACSIDQNPIDKTLNFIWIQAPNQSQPYLLNTHHRVNGPDARRNSKRRRITKNPWHASQKTGYCTCVEILRPLIKQSFASIDFYKDNMRRISFLAFLLNKKGW